MELELTPDASAEPELVAPELMLPSVVVLPFRERSPEELLLDEEGYVEFVLEELEVCATHIDAMPSVARSTAHRIRRP